MVDEDGKLSGAITADDIISVLRQQVSDSGRCCKRLRYQIAIFLSVLGPGLITANVDNDSGGIYTYSAGRREVRLSAALDPDPHHACC